MERIGKVATTETCGATETDLFRRNLYKYWEPVIKRLDDVQPLSGEILMDEKGIAKVLLWSDCDWLRAA